MRLIIEKMYDDVLCPTKKHSKDSGFDLYCYGFTKHFGVSGDKLVGTIVREDLELHPYERCLVSTGVKARLDYKNESMSNFCHEYEVCWELQVRPRSGTALNRGLTILNTPGTVDNGYNGEIMLIVVNNSGIKQKIEIGERLAQLVPCLVALPTIQYGVVDSSDGRGENGFNSTGKF